MGRRSDRAVRRRRGDGEGPQSESVCGEGDEVSIDGAEGTGDKKLVVSILNSIRSRRLPFHK